MEQLYLSPAPTTLFTSILVVLCSSSIFFYLTKKVHQFSVQSLSSFLAMRRVYSQFLSLQHLYIISGHIQNQIGTWKLRRLESGQLKESLMSLERTDCSCFLSFQLSVFFLIFCIISQRIYHIFHYLHYFYLFVKL